MQLLYALIGFTGGFTGYMTLYGINAVSALLIIIFAVPLLAGLFGMLSRERIRYSLNSLFDNLELVVGILIAVYLTKRIFFVQDGSFFTSVFNLIPEKIKSLLYGQDMLTYVITVPILLLLVLLVLRLFTTPLYRHFVLPASDRLYNGISSMGPVARRLTGAAWMIPKALVFTLITAFFLNFSMYYISSPILSEWVQDSKEYQFIYRNVMYPVLNSSIAKKASGPGQRFFQKSCRKTICLR